MPVAGREKGGEVGDFAALRVAEAIEAALA
jgi:hypothetical protein